MQLIAAANFHTLLRIAKTCKMPDFNTQISIIWVVVGSAADLSEATCQIAGQLGDRRDTDTERNTHT